MKPNLLIVEDDPLQNELLQVFATSVGYDARAAFTATEALALFDEDAPDIVLLDYELPDMLGKDLVTTMRQRMVGRWLPILFLSAHNELRIQQECLQAGGDDFIAKPVNLTILESKLKAMGRVATMQKTIVEQNQALSSHISRANQEGETARYLYERLTRARSKPIPFFQQALIPTESFSGDLIIVNQGSNGHYYAVVADATGHGLSAAIGLIPMTQVFRAMSQKGHNVSAIVTEMHKQLRAYTPSYRFIAAVVLEIDPSNHSLSIWNGGMPDAIVFSATHRTLHHLRSRHLPLGVEGSQGFSADVEHYVYGEGEQLFCCSDGLLEASNSNREPLCWQDIERLLLDSPNELVLDLLIGRLKAHIQQETPVDDVALLLATLPDPKTEASTSRSAVDMVIPESRWAMTFSGPMLRRFDPVPLAIEWLGRANLNASALSRAHTILMELVTNAIDHGLLSLNSGMKEQPDGFVHYLHARHQRLNELQNGEIELILDLVRESTSYLLRIEVRDSGQGYSETNDSPFSPLQKSGRGLRLVRRMSRSMNVIAPGNRITVEMTI